MSDLMPKPSVSVTRLNPDGTITRTAYATVEEAFAAIRPKTADTTDNPEVWPDKPYSARLEYPQSTKSELAGRLIDLLFPAPVQQEPGYWLDSGVDEIEGAIIDIKRQGMTVDAACMSTLERVADKLREARRLVQSVVGDRMP